MEKLVVLHKLQISYSEKRFAHATSFNNTERSLRVCDASQKNTN